MHVSVVIAFYKAEKFIQKAVKSCLDLPEVKEIILIDDDSPDNSFEICSKLAQKDQRIGLFKHPDKKNHGAPASWNLGIEKVTQEYFTILGADDFFLPNRFDKEKQVFKKNPDAEGVYGALGTHYYSKGKNQDLYSDMTTANYHCPPKYFLKAFIGLKYKDFGGLSLCAMTFKTQSIKHHRIAFNEKLKLHQDSDFIIKTGYYLNLYFGEIKKPVAMRGVHESNRITAHKENTLKFLNNKLLYCNEVLQWMTKEKLGWFIKLPLQLEKYYYHSIKNKKPLLAKIIIRLRYRLYLLNKLTP